MKFTFSLFIVVIGIYAGASRADPPDPFRFSVHLPNEERWVHGYFRAERTLWMRQLRPFASVGPRQGVSSLIDQLLFVASPDAYIPDLNGAMSFPINRKYYSVFKYLWFHGRALLDFAPNRDLSVVDIDFEHRSQIGILKSLVVEVGTQPNGKLGAESISAEVVRLNSGIIESFDLTELGMPRSEKSEESTDSKARFIEWGYYHLDGTVKRYGTGTSCPQLMLMLTGRTFGGLGDYRKKRH